MLEQEAYAQFRAAQEDRPPRPFSCRLFGQIAARWGEWQRGIPPSRGWTGRGAQNPYLLAAFARLDQAEARAQQAVQMNRR